MGVHLFPKRTLQVVSYALVCRAQNPRPRAQPTENPNPHIPPRLNPNSEALLFYLSPSEKRKDARKDQALHVSAHPSLTLSINLAQKPYIIGSLGPNALQYGVL